jgi:fatty-acyl-CoA synthase
MNIPLTPIRFLRYAREQYPEKTAVVCDGQRLTYSEFNDRAARLAGAVRVLGAEPGDRVAFLSSNCHRLLEGYYGVPSAGAVLLPLNIRLSAGELAYILNDAGAKILFVESQFLPLVDSFRRQLSSVRAFVLNDGEPQADWLESENYEALIARSEPFYPDVMSIDENALAELFYTSGTSANPKGVMLTHRNVYLHALYVCIAHSTTSESVQLHTIPLFHANGWGVAHSLTFAGGTHVMIHRFDPAAVFRLVQEERVQACSLVPAMAIALVNCPERTKYDLSSLRQVMIGGAASSPTLVAEVEAKLGCTCWAGYGLTETAPVLTISPVKGGLETGGNERSVRQAMAGFAIPGVEIRVVDADDNDVPHDGVSIGEVVARSDGVMAGYWNQPEATTEVMRNGWFHTGDMATIDEHGYVLVVDRKKDIIVSGGENVSSLEVERILAAHPAIYEAAVVPVPDGVWGEVPKALVVLRPGSHATESEIVEFCRSRLTHYKCPRSVDFLESLPRTGTGKVLKRELRKKYWQGQETIQPHAAEQQRKGSPA